MISTIILNIQREFLNFIRDRNTLISSIIFPILMYPLVFWGMSQIMMLQRGNLEQMPSRLGFANPPPAELVMEILESGEDYIINSDIIVPRNPGSLDLKNLELDAIIETVTCDPNASFQIFYDESSDRSKTAKKRIEGIFEAVQLDSIADQAANSGAQLPDFNIIDVDMSSSTARSQYILGILLPMLIVIITVMGGLYPAIEVIVGERERQTLETTFSAPVPTFVILISKFLSVILMSMFAALLNIVSILLTLKQTLLQGDEVDDLHFTLPLQTLPMLFLGTLLTATMFSAAMILFASAARNFKEGQSFVMPIYVLGIQPAVVSAIPGVPFNSLTAWIPIANISLLFRELIRGSLTLLPALITIGSLMLWCFVLLYLATKFIRSDEIILDKPVKFLSRLRKNRSESKGVHN